MRLETELGDALTTLKRTGHSPTRIDVIPCGQCIGCRLDYSREWATRIMLEAKQWKNNWFITLTYNDENLPYRARVNTETGELMESAPLCPEDLQLFMKRLRKHWSDKYKHQNIRFYACGEYGEENGRPHYHIAIFNLPLQPKALKWYKRNEQYQTIWTCPELEEIWGMGFVTVGALTYQSAAYIARYMCKKQKGKDQKEYYEMLGLTPEFSRMSLKPGIGAAAYKKEYYEKDYIQMPDGRQVKPPKYFERMFEEDGGNLKAIKEQRKAAATLIEQRKDEERGTTRTERLKREEETKTSRANALKRS